ncbi:AI-2E family transporter [Georgfuchsia toluolica]|uniref:AI-2E family transporter n=1 Tax=Georgfuchsia toluolica TaxID=424218 RepID=A0A916N1T9_9PROT|nr:AI-2E family transporter [Georgfuchsia toluolica]CAG4883044.1 AI-2E family transporter [Georgfuchsia toluolica]
MQPSDSDRYLGFAALALLIVGCVVVLHAFLTALLWAVILVSVTWPAFAHLDRWLGHRRNFSALAMTCVVSLVMIAPFAVVTLGLVDNATQLSAAIGGQLERGLPDAPAWLIQIPLVGASLSDYWQNLAHDSSRLTDELQRLLPSAQHALLAAGKTLGSGLMQLTLSVFIAFFLFRDGEEVDRRAIAVASRVAGQRGRYLLEIASNTVTGVVYGILGTALAQGVLAGIGFAIAGVPGALLLGLATFFLSIIPVGPPLIWIGAALWLFQQGDTGWAIFVVLWGFFIVSMVDNIIKPLIISRGSSMPFVLVFLGVLGGVVSFGLIGVFLGPTLLAVGYRLLNEWSSALVEPTNADSPAE